jgi:predicted transcriptional regulator
MALTVSPELEKRLTAVASSMARDPQEVFEGMLAGCVEDEERIAAAIRAGIESAERGEGTPHDEVFAKLERKLLDKYGVRV